MKIAIAGAGIMGRVLALSLMQAGHHISLFDQDTKQGQNSCSFAAAGMLAPMMELEKSPELIYQLGLDALTQHWPHLLAQLSRPVYFQKQGSLLLAHPNDQAALTHFISILDRKIKQLSYQYLDKQSLSSFEPALQHFSQAYHFPIDGQINSQGLLQALEFELVKYTDWYELQEVITVSPHQIKTKDRIHHFDLVFDCRGMGGREYFSELYGVRGELIYLHAPEVNLTRPIRFIHPRYPLYIVPRPHHHYLIGASEIIANDNSPISVRSTLELLTAAYYLNAGFAEARLVKSMTQIRPSLANHLPLIKYTDGLVAINGLYRHGYLITPTLVNDILNWLNADISKVKYSQIWEKI